MSGPRGSDELVVIGAGVMGAWTALEAVRAGWRTTLVDAFGAGSPRATSGDETRIIRASHGPDAFLTQWSRDAREAWIAFGEEIGESVFVEAGAAWFAQREDGFEAASLETLRSLGVPVERLSSDATSARWPQVAASDLAFTLFEPEAGLLMARRGVAAAARRVVELGGTFEQAVARPGASGSGRLHEVELGDGRRLAADRFVFTCGPWLPRLFPDVVGDLIRVTKQDVCFVGPPGGDRRFEHESLPCWVDYDASYYGIPGVDGRGLKIAPDRYGPVFDPSRGDRLVDPDTVRLARAYLARRFPELAGAPVVETRVCQYETTPDTQFVIDRHPEFENAWIVGGGSGHGFKHGPVIGRYVVDRLAGHEPGLERARFRIGPRPVGEGGAGGMRTGADQIVAGWDGY